MSEKGTEGRLRNKSSWGVCERYSCVIFKKEEIVMKRSTYEFPYPGSNTVNRKLQLRLYTLHGYPKFEHTSLPMPPENTFYMG